MKPRRNERTLAAVMTVVGVLFCRNRESCTGATK